MPDQHNLNLLLLLDEQVHEKVNRLILHQNLDDLMGVTLEPIKLNQPAQDADIVVHAMT